MSVDLKKGGRVDLQKTIPGLKKVIVNLGWKENQYSTGGDYDLDVTAFICKYDTNGDPKCEGEKSILFYNSCSRTSDGKTTFVDNGAYPKKGRPCTPGMELVHSGDNTNGKGEGPDESIIADVEKILATADEVSFVITINEAAERKQNFGQISKAYVEIVNAEGGAVIARYDLEESFSNETAVLVGALYKNSDNHLAFKAVGQGYSLGLVDFCKGYGLMVK